MTPATAPLPVDRRRFEAELIPHLDAMHRTARRLTRNGSDAEDLVQDAVLKAYRFFDRYEPGTNLRAWLLRVLTNVFLSGHRRNGLDVNVRAMATVDPVSDGWIGAATMAGSRDPERAVEKPLVEGAVARALSTLPEEHRVVLVLSDIEGLSYREIADTMGTPIGTVMSRLHRARRAVAEQLGVAKPGARSEEKPAADGGVVSIDAFRARRAAGGEGGR